MVAEITLPTRDSVGVFMDILVSYASENGLKIENSSHKVSKSVEKYRDDSIIPIFVTVYRERDIDLVVDNSNRPHLSPLIYFYENSSKQISRSEHLNLVSFLRDLWMVEFLDPEASPVFLSSSKR